MIPTGKHNNEPHNHYNHILIFFQNKVMDINPDKVSATPKRKRDVAVESTKSKFGRLEAEDVMQGDAPVHDPLIDPLSIPADIVPSHSNDPDIVDPLEEYYPSRIHALTVLKRERYAKAANGDEMYNPHDERYATYTLDVDGIDHIVEYVPLRHDKSPRFLRDDKNNIIYPFDLTSEQPFFEVDSEQNEKYLKEGTKEICPLKNGIPVYAKLHTKDEYVPTNQNVPYYASDKDGNQHYPLTSEGHQYYIWIKNEQIPAKTVDNYPFYAETKDGDQYYPRRIALGHA